MSRKVAKIKKLSSLPINVNVDNVIVIVVTATAVGIVVMSNLYVLCNQVSHIP